MNSTVLSAACFAALSLSALGGTELKSFRPFPPASDREAWEKAAALPEIREFREKMIARAEELLDQPVPALSMVRFMDFVRNGNRAKYERMYFDRRQRLSALVLAECFTGKGRYLDTIVDYLCALESEYTWCLPAHSDTNGTDVFPFYRYERIDLFSAETSCQLAMTLEVLEPELTKISPNLVKRLKKILYDRTVLSVENTDIEPYSWMKGRNNWTPWVISNLLWSANYSLKDDSAHLTAFAKRLMPGLERYYANYPDDGCCTEGPGYWGVSVIRYFLTAEFFFRASGGKINIFSDPKFRRMGEYICGPWIRRNCYVPFSDNNMKINYSCGLLRAMGRRFDSSPLLTLADRAQKEAPFRPGNFFIACSGIFAPQMELKNFSGEEDKQVFFSGSEQFFCRRGNQFFAVKGGCNAESHNHLDVGQFFFMSGDDGIVIDPGSTVYDRTTFSSRRYTQWCRNSTGHNPMLFDGIGQELGVEARTASFKVDGTNVCMDLTPAYKAEAGLKSYRRELRFGGTALLLHDSYEAKKAVQPQLRIYSLLPQLPIREKTEIKTEKIGVTDDNLRANWGDTLYLHCIDLPKSEKGEITLTFDPALIKR